MGSHCRVPPVRVKFKTKQITLDVDRLRIVSSVFIAPLLVVFEDKLALDPLIGRIKLGLALLDRVWNLYLAAELELIDQL